MSGESTDRSGIGTGDDDEPFAFEAYPRSDGSIGVRNRVLVVPSVICSRIVAERIADGVDGAVCTPHDHGCGQIGADNDQTERTLRNVARNPNIAGACVVGLGCEHVQSNDLAEAIADHGVPVHETAIQDAGGTDECLDVGQERVRELVADARDARQVRAGLGDLTVGIVTTDLSDPTREVAQPVVDDLIDRLLDADARVLVTGTDRIAVHADKAAERARNDAAEGIRRAAERDRNQPARVRRIMARSAELPFEDVVGWGSGSIEEFIPYGERATLESGLGLVDAPSRFEEAATALAAAGANVVVHVTDEGIPTGHPVVPVIKATGSAETAAALPRDIDVDCTEATAEALLERLEAAANGTPTATDRHGLTEFAISRAGPSL